MASRARATSELQSTASGPEGIRSWGVREPTFGDGSNRGISGPTESWLAVTNQASPSSTTTTAVGTVSRTWGTPAQAPVGVLKRSKAKTPMASSPGSSESSRCSSLHSCHSLEAACKGPRSSKRRSSRPWPSRRRAVPPFASTTKAVPHPNRRRPAEPGVSRTRSGDLPCRAHRPASAPSGAGRIR